MSTTDALRQIFAAGRPLIEQWLDVAEQIAGLREVATAAGLDWSQVKALLKAQIQDERDEDGEGKRVRRIVEKAEFASAYAEMLGLANMNENNFSAEPSGISGQFPNHNPETGEVIEIPAGSAASGQAALSGECPEAPLPDEARKGPAGTAAIEQQTEAPKQRPEAVANSAAHIDTPAAGKSFVQGSSEADGPGGVQDECAIHPATLPQPPPLPAAPPETVLPAPRPAVSGGPRINPHCQKPDTCKWRHSMASCSPCNNAAAAARMQQRQGVAA